MEHVGAASALGERAGAVGRGVVDHEDVQVLAGERGADALDHAARLVGLVVGGEDEPDGAGHGRAVR